MANPLGDQEQEHQHLLLDGNVSQALEINEPNQPVN